MKPLPIIALGLITTITLASCSSSPTPPTESLEKTPAVEASTTSESENILDLKMENGLKELDMVE